MIYFKNKRRKAKYYILDLMEFNDVYLWSEIKRYIDKKSENEINDSTFTNALKQLVEDQIIIVDDKNNYYLDKQTEVRKEDFIDVKNLKTLMESTIDKLMIDINRVTIDNMEELIKEINELPNWALERYNQELSKDIVPLRVNDYKKKISELQKQLRKIAKDLDI